MKIKPLTNEQLIISIDRLTRFKDPETKYLRVFKDIITNNLIEPKFKKSELDEMDYSEITHLAENIINSSFDSENISLEINKQISDYENQIFIINKETQKLLNNKINYNEIIKLLPDKIPDNLKFLKKLCGENINTGVFPIKKIILCEGITEEILLPKFGKICNFDLDQNGIYIISAGGKNQVVKYFYQYSECLKIPIFILLDNDAKENFMQISPRLRKYDKIHLVKSGEFEDLLPKSLIEKTLKSETKNISINDINLQKQTSTVEFLTEFFRHRGLHEFKKADFAQAVKSNITGINDVSPEIFEIFNELKI